MDFIYKIFLFLFISLNLSCTSKTLLFDIIDEQILNKKKVYLVFRGTDTKQGYFASNFNLKHKVASHVGIAIYSKGNWKIFHIINSIHKGNHDFRSSNFKTFFNETKENIKYASVWEITHLKIKEREKLITELANYSSMNIKFDKSFSLDSSQLYCSEFINNILNKVNKNKFRFKIHKRKLTTIQSKFLKKDTLYYYPVDVFQFHNNIQKIKEWNLN